MLIVENRPVLRGRGALLDGLGTENHATFDDIPAILAV
jgi:hypothetical protein